MCYIEGAWYFKTLYLVGVFNENSLMILNFYKFDIFSTFSTKYRRRQTETQNEHNTQDKSNKQGVTVVTPRDSDAIIHAMLTANPKAKHLHLKWNICVTH